MISNFLLIVRVMTKKNMNFDQTCAEFLKIEKYGRKFAKSKCLEYVITSTIPYNANISPGLIEVL